MTDVPADPQSVAAMTDLVKLIWETTCAGITSDELKQGTEHVMRQKVEYFEYSDKGVGPVNLTHHEIDVPSWRDSIFRVYNSVHKSTQFSVALERIKTSFPEKHLDQSLFEFCYRAILSCLKGQLGDKNQTELIAQFLSDLRGDPVLCNVKAELAGIALRMKDIPLTDALSIRQTLPEDLQEEFPLTLGGIPRNFVGLPSAILDIKLCVKYQSEVQTFVDKVATILSLFKVASVKVLSHETHSNAIGRFLGGTMQYHHSGTIFKTGLLLEQDAERLKKFWELMHDKLPDSFLRFWEIKESEHAAIAFTRYKDALFYSFAPERRIMDAVMSIETLYLGGGELSELKHRVKNRVAKLLSHLGHDPLEVSNILEIAYSVRNPYAHGAMFKKKKKEQLESQFGNMDVLIEKILDYSRKSILFFLLSKKKKNKIIELIDKALISEPANQELKELVGVWNQYLAQ